MEFTERDLAYHMVIEHTLFFFLGYLSVQVAEIVLKFLISSDTDRKNNLKGKIILFWTRVLRMIFTVNRYGYVFSFIVVGAVGFLAARSLGESFKLFALFALNGIMGFAGLMLSVMDTSIYLVYSVHSHNNAGIWMLIMCIVLLVIVIPVYVIKRALFYARIRQAYRTD